MEKDHLEIILEDIQSKFELVIEGHAGLHQEIKEMRQDMNERFELVDFKIDTLNKKIDDDVDAKLSKKINDVEKSLKKEINRVEQKVDNVAADLSAHRADTESHGKGYRVSEL